MDTIAHTIERAAAAVLAADVLFIGAGAGMGVDSGLPDFRGTEGFWRAYPALKNEGLSFIDCANPQQFRFNPKRAWGFYGHRLELYRATIPHRGFSLLQQWANSKAYPAFVFTSNVDGQFQRAGFATDSIYEVHGSIQHLQCSVPCNDHIWPAPSLQLAINKARLTAEGPLPTCPHCGAIARPNILMFGDHAWIDHRSAQQHQQLQGWYEQHQLRNIVSIEVGAGIDIPTVRHASEHMPGTTIRINPRHPQGNKSTISLALGGLDGLQRIHQALENRPQQK